MNDRNMSSEALTQIALDLHKTTNHFYQRQTHLDDVLVQAAFSGDLSLVEWLLTKGARVEYWQDPVFADFSMEELIFKSSAILVACQQGHLDVVICLHKSASKSKLENTREGFRHYWAILIETLRNRNQVLGRNTAKDDEGRYIDLDVDPFLQPYCFLDNLPLLKYLIDCGAELNIRGQSGKTPLIKAASNPRYAQALDILLQAGADPNITSKQHHSALACAARHGNIKAMRTLLQYGAHLEHPMEDLQASNSDREASPPHLVCHALVLCVALGHVAEARLLIEHGARPRPIPRYFLYTLHLLDHSDLTRYTDCISYLHLAFYTAQPEVIQFFLDINFFSPSDLFVLRWDRDLLRRLMITVALEYEEEADDYNRRRELDSPDGLSRDNLGSRMDRSGSSASGGVAKTRRPNFETLRMLKNYSVQPPTLFSLSVMCVRQTCGSDSWTQEHTESSLGLPKPLVKRLLYSDVYLRN